MKSSEKQEINGFSIGSLDFDNYFTSLLHVPEFDSVADAVIGRLRNTNPILIPSELAAIFPRYSTIYEFKKSPKLWCSTERLAETMKNYGKGSKALLLISGIAAGGKDALREEIEKLYPGFLYKLVTATTRSMRKGEKNGSDYYFMTQNEFLKGIHENTFLEHTPQGERMYGLPIQSLQDALRRQEQVLCSHVEMSAWPTVSRYLSENITETESISTEKIFVIPNMLFTNYADKWLPERRPHDTLSRLRRTAWELHHAPFVSDFILTNKIDSTGIALEQEAQIIHEHAWRLLRSYFESEQLTNVE